jgi:energy-coupling factor transporter ATP-binding protein EcfA2
VRAGVVHVPEGRRVFPDLTVLENLEVPAFARRAADADRRACLDRVYGVFPLLAERRAQRASSLSGGQQQMLAIGRGLMSAPRILMVDEASLGLAPATTDEMFEALSRLGADGLSILLVEQNARASLEIAARAYVLERGCVRLSGTAADLLHEGACAPPHPHRHGLRRGGGQVPQCRDRDRCGQGPSERRPGHRRGSERQPGPRDSAGGHRHRHDSAGRRNAGDGRAVRRFVDDPGIRPGRPGLPPGRRSHRPGGTGHRKRRYIDIQPGGVSDLVRGDHRRSRPGRLNGFRRRR